MDGLKFHVRFYVPDDISHQVAKPQRDTPSMTFHAKPLERATIAMHKLHAYDETYWKWLHK